MAEDPKKRQAAADAAVKTLGKKWADVAKKYGEASEQYREAEKSYRAAAAQNRGTVENFKNAAQTY